MPTGTVATYCAAKAGSSSPAANTWILMRLLDLLSTRSAKVAALPGPTW